MLFLLILGIIGIYILSIIIIHLFYKNSWIEQIEAASRSRRYDRFCIKYNGSEVDTSLGSFYYWMSNSDDVFVNPIVIFIPVLNTLTVFLIIFAYIFMKVGSFFNKIGAKIGSIKFVKLD